MGRKKDWRLRGRVYLHIHNYIRKCGYAPTFNEIAVGARVSVAKVAGYLRDLERVGLIVRTNAYCRNIRLTIDEKPRPPTAGPTLEGPHERPNQAP